MKLYPKAANFYTNILIAEWHQMATSVHETISSKINAEFTNYKLWLKLINSLLPRLKLYFSEILTNDSPWQVEQWYHFSILTASLKIRLCNAK